MTRLFHLRLPTGSEGLRDTAEGETPRSRLRDVVEMKVGAYAL